MVAGACGRWRRTCMLRAYQAYDFFFINIIKHFNSPHAIYLSPLIMRFSIISAIVGFTTFTSAAPVLSKEIADREAAPQWYGKNSDPERGP